MDPIVSNMSRVNNQNNYTDIFDEEFRVFYANSSPKRNYEISKKFKNTESILAEKH